MKYCSTVSIVSVAARTLISSGSNMNLSASAADRRRHGRAEERGLQAGRACWQGSSRRPRGSRGRASRRPRRARRSACRVEDEGVTAHEVHHTSDSADDHLATLAQVAHLVADRGAAEDGDHLDALLLAVRAQGLRHLDAELARRCEDECFDVLRPRVDVLEKREAERGGLAGSGLGLTDYVTALQKLGDRLLLNRRRLGRSRDGPASRGRAAERPSSAKVVIRTVQTTQRGADVSASSRLGRMRRDAVRSRWP